MKFRFAPFRKRIAGIFYPTALSQSLRFCRKVIVLPSRVSAYLAVFATHVGTLKSVITIKRPRSQSG
jgi:hypothetical protein